MENSGKSRGEGGKKNNSNSRLMISFYLQIIHSELSRLTNRQKVQEERERAMYQRMMGQDNNRGDKKKSDGGVSINLYMM